MAAGEVESEVVKKGVKYLLQAPRRGAKWEEEYYNAVGFPRVFYLRYHGYSVFFPYGPLVDIVILAPQTLKIVHTEFEPNRNHHRNAN